MAVVLEISEACVCTADCSLLSSFGMLLSPSIGKRKESGKKERHRSRERVCGIPLKSGPAGVRSFTL